MPILQRLTKGVVSGIKSLSSHSIKTTPKITGSAAKAVSGGKVIPSAKTNFLKGAGSTANVGGKVIAGTTILAVPAAAGIYGLDLFKNTLARNDDFYQTRDTNKNYSQETQNLKDRIAALDSMQGSDSANDGNSSNYYLKGGSTSPASSDVNSSTIPLIIGGVALAGVAVLLYKNSRRGKK